MEFFETQNLILVHLLCLTSLKSKVMFLIFFFRFLFFLLFYFDLEFLTFSFCVCFMILSSVIAYFSGSKLQLLGLLLFLFYFFYFFLFLTKSNCPIIHLNHKPEPAKTIFYFWDRLDLIFVLYSLDWMTILGPNPLSTW
jgi:multisubunit Na+/H+ antiporter MnhE subunit